MTILDHYPIHITSPFGMRTHPITKEKKMHYGIDLSCPVGTLIRTPVAGTVRFTKTDSASAGIYIFLECMITGDKYGFMHLSKLLCKKGDIVQKGQIIALSGNTGASTGPHLHFERSVDPKWGPDGYVSRLNEKCVDPTDKILIDFSKTP